MRAISRIVTIGVFVCMAWGEAAWAQVVALGASNTAGQGVSSSEAYPAQLEAMLAARGKNVRVANAGVSGDTTGGMLGRLDGDVPQGTRIVILQAGFNDMRRGGGGAERQAYPGLYDALTLLLDNFGDAELWPPIYARFELGLLSELGYGLDLERCAITGETENLAFVSPRTGRAATREAGEPFADKLLRLPPFVRDPDVPVEEGDVADALALAGYFLERRVFDHIGQGMPEQRRRLIEALGYSGRL